MSQAASHTRGPVLSESILCEMYGGQSDNGTLPSVVIMSPVLHTHFHSSASDAIWPQLLTMSLNNTLKGIRRTCHGGLDV